MKKYFLIFMIFPFYAQAEILEGVVKNPKGEVIYLEKHTIQRDDSGLSRFIRVEYSKPGGKVFATMTSDFSKHRTIPETEFEDKRFNTKSLIRITENTVEFEEIKNDKTASKRSFPLTKTMVASQGFDNFIQIHSPQLNTDPVNFKFGVLENKDFYTLTGYRRTPASEEEVEYGIKASSWFLRLFADELRVSYDAKNRKLKSFVGRSNILDDSGNPQDVAISYQWKTSDEK
jgi:hypothetical protein